jgi:hypothetical protein
MDGCMLPIARFSEAIVVSVRQREIGDSYLEFSLASCVIEDNPEAVDLLAQ